MNPILYFEPEELELFTETDHDASTIEYYNAHVVEFCESTRDISFSEMQDRFLNELSPGSRRILDLGCGSGRDTKYFCDHGYDVDACDASAEMCRVASDFTGIAVRQMCFDELNDIGRYDGIWACASLLHVPFTELAAIIRAVTSALTPEGVLYMSFKYGIFDGIRAGRYFCDMTEERLDEILSIANVPLHMLECWITGDARTGRENEKWLNVLMKKTRSRMF